MRGPIKMRHSILGPAGRTKLPEPIEAFDLAILDIFNKTDLTKKVN